MENKKVQIGMLIWKEVKNQGLSQAKFIEMMRERNVIIRDIFRLETIDVNALIQISIVLKRNFFNHYEHEGLIGLVKTEERETNKIAALKAVIKEQDRLLLTHKKMISQQNKLIAKLKDDLG